MERPPAPVCFTFGAFSLVPGERLLHRAGEAIGLSPKAFDLLSFFVANPARLLTKDEILQAVWPDVVVEESNLAYHVFSIRKALGDNGLAEPFIETVPKRGYRFIAAVERTGYTATATPTHDSVLRFQESLWGEPAEPMTFAVSPDSRHMVMAVQGADCAPKWWVRTLSEATPRPLRGSEGFLMPPPIWSPTGDALAFSNGGPLKRMPIAGGVVESICDLTGIAVGGSWSRDHVILVGNPYGPVLQCPATGGEARPATEARDPFEIHLMPSFLGDGRHFMYLRVHRTAPDRSGIYVGHLDKRDPADERRLLATGFQAVYVPASSAGSAAIVFVRDGLVVAQRFDEQRFELDGPPVPLAGPVGSYLDFAYFSASPRILAYRAPDPLYQLVWFDRGGRQLREIGGPEPVAGLALSPSGTRAIVVRHLPHNVADQDLWLFDLESDANPRRLTFAPTLERWPSWLTDETFAYGASGGELGVYQQTIDGPRRIWLRTGGSSGVTTADGGRIAIFVGFSSTRRAELWVWIEQGPPNGLPLIAREGDQTQARLSPDGEWLAYVSNETGRNEVFVAPLYHDRSSGTCRAGVPVPVSNGGGFAPQWRGDGSELFYLQSDGSVMALRAEARAGVDTGSARRLFKVPGVFPEWGVTRDGDRLLFAVPTAPRPTVQIVQNWMSLLG